MTDNLNPEAAGFAAPADRSLITYTNVIYALHSLALLVGIVGSATIVGSFVGSLPSIVAVIMNYVRQAEVRGTFLESHFRWQIRTFWFALLWLLVSWAVSLPLLLVLIGFPLLAAGLLATGIWVIYRVIRGWTALSARRPMYV